MTWVIVVLLLLLLLWQVSSLTLSHKRRLHLFNYTLYMILDDAMRADQRAKFEDWIRKCAAKDQRQLFSMARQVLEGHIENWAKATPSTVAAHALLWNAAALVRGTGRTNSAVATE